MPSNLERYGVFALIFVLLLIVSISIWGQDDRERTPAGDGSTGHSRRESRLLVGADPVHEQQQGSELEAEQRNEPREEPPIVRRREVPVFPPVPPEERRSAAPRTYTVKDKDNPSKIAEALYGSQSFAKDIMAANPGLNERRMHPGQKIKLPDLRERRSSSPPPPARNGESSRGDALQNLLQQRERVHVVAKGESLETIALRYYGTRSKVDAILAANPEISNANRIYPGWRIQLP